MTLLEAIEYVESLGIKISLNGIGMGVIRQLADIMKAKFLSIPDKSILVIQTEDMPDYKTAQALKKAIGDKQILFVSHDTEVSVMEAERAILHILSKTNATVEERKHLAEVIALGD